MRATPMHQSDVPAVPIEHAEVLDELIPKPEVASAYVNRKVRGLDDFEVFDFARANQHNILLAGPTGSAKTTAVLAYASSRRLPVATISCHHAAEPTEWQGQWAPTMEGLWDFAPHEVLLIGRYRGVIILDEIDRALPGIAAFLHSMLDQRRQLTVPVARGSSWPSLLRLSDETLIVAAYNRGYAGHIPLDWAFHNRFTHTIDWDYDRDVEVALIRSRSLLDLGERLRQRAKMGDFATPISTNRLMTFERLVDDLGWEYASANFAEHFAPEERQALIETMELFSERICAELGADRNG